MTVSQDSDKDGGMGTWLPHLYCPEDEEPVLWPHHMDFIGDV